MAKGISLHIGLNSVDPNHYGNWDGQLIACEADADDMQLIANSQGFTCNILFTKDATRQAVIGQIWTAAKQLGDGDIFLLTYSGHGGQLPDLDNEEPDGLDETWCLFDGQVVDDELYRLWSSFKEGVRILVISDSCHSGTVTKMALVSKAIDEDRKPAIKAMPNSIASRTYLKNKEFYDKILTLESPSLDSIYSSVRLISGCQDNQLSEDGAFNGKFTGMLKRVWNGGKFKGNYQEFVDSIVKMMPPRQTPNHFIVGKANPSYDKQTPFSI